MIETPVSLNRSDILSFLVNSLLKSLLFRTLIDSTPGVLKAWHIFSNDYNLGDSATIAHATHGRRLYDTLKEYCGLVEEDLMVGEFFTLIFVNNINVMRLERNRSFRGRSHSRGTNGLAGCS